MKNFTKKLLDAEKKCYWAAPEGKRLKGQAFLKLSDDPFMKLIIGMLQGIIDERKQEQDMLRGTLKTMGITPADNNTNIYILCNTLLNAKIVLENAEAYGYEIDSLTGYMKRVIRLDGIITEEPEHPTYMHKVDGVWIFDEDKYNAMLSAL